MVSQNVGVIRYTHAKQLKQQPKDTTHHDFRPQVRAFAEAAEAMKGERYWEHENTEDERVFIQVFSEVLTEVAFQLNRYKILD